MGIETAFLFGVIVGQWLMLWAIYRAVVRLTRLLAAQDHHNKTNPPSSHEIIEIE